MLSRGLLLAVLVAAPGTFIPWELVSEDGGLKVYRRPNPNARVYAHKVEATLGAPAARLWFVLRDSVHHKDYMPYVEESRILRESGKERILYQRLGPPIVSDRDYTLRIESDVDEATGIYEQHFYLANEAGPPEVDGVVRVPVASGRWLLEPLSATQTHVVYELLTDPGGWLPAWAVNFAQKTSFPDLFEALEKRAKDPTWTP